MKSLFEGLGGTCYQESDYFLPDLIPPESIPVGAWGQLRRHCLKTRRTTLLLSGKLDSYLSKIDTQEETMFFQLIEQMAEQESTTEQLKANHLCPFVCVSHFL